MVQALLSLHTSAAPLHVPPAQASGPVHALLSLHASVLSACAQPVVGLQVSVVHSTPSSQPSALPAVQAPAWQLSATVHTLPSASQPVPLVTGAKTHAPVEVLQLSDVQLLPSLQVIALPALHAPPVHTSPIVHALPSLHVALLSTWTQPVTGLQLSSVHGLPSSHASAPAATQLVPTHASLGVHTLLSALHAAPLF